jgi:hypothetical protein
MLSFGRFGAPRWRSVLKHLFSVLATLSMLVCIGCTEQQNPQPTPPVTASVTAQADSSPSAPSSQWFIQDPKTNPIDGIKLQFITLGSTEGKAEDHYISGVGSMPFYKSTAKIVLCFESGKLCGGSSIGARVDVDGFISSDGSSVRLKYDDGKPSREHWAGSDNHNAIFPYGRDKQLLFNLLKHHTLYFEFSNYEEAPKVVTFEVAGLADAMKKSGLTLPRSQ